MLPWSLNGSEHQFICDNKHVRDDDCSVHWVVSTWTL
jgi:hypothetical protein